MTQLKRIVFMGTPDFAVASLKALHESEHHVVGVVTVADKPAGRGRKLKASAVKEYAVAHDIPLLQPLKLKDPEFTDALKAWNADLFAVVAFRMLPEVVWQMPKYGTINLHGSLLPDYRGAAPIHWAVMNGDERTGCSTFFIEKEIDTGNILKQAEFAIGVNDTTGDVHDTMKEMGAALLVETCTNVFSGTIEAVPQNQFDLSNFRPAPKLFKEDCQLDWSKPASQIHNFIRGLNPFPSAWTFLGESTYKIHFGIPTERTSNANPGSIIQDKEGMYVVCGDHKLYSILVLQPQGKRRLEVADFILGHDLNNEAFS